MKPLVRSVQHCLLALPLVLAAGLSAPAGAEPEATPPVPVVATPTPEAATTPAVPAAVSSALIAPKDPAAGLLPVSGLTTSTDIYIRGERDMTGNSNGPDSVDRARYGVYTGARYELPDGTAFGLRFKTDNPFSPVSPFTTVDPGQTFGMSVDQAYVELHPGSRENLLQIGDFARPWQCSPVWGDAQWSRFDSTGGVNFTHKSENLDTWVSAGYLFALPLQIDDPLSEVGLASFQVGHDWHAQHGQRLEATLGALMFDVTGGGEKTLVSLNRGNALVKVNGVEQLASGFDIIDPCVTYYFHGSSGLPMAAMVEYYRNMAGSNPSAVVDGKDGYTFGVKAGECRYPGKFSVRLIYAHIGQDAAVSGINQLDFPSGTNFEGYWLQAQYPITPHITLCPNVAQVDSGMDHSSALRGRMDVLVHF